METIQKKFEEELAKFQKTQTGNKLLINYYHYQKSYFFFVFNLLKI